MIICSCNIISSREIEDVVLELLNEDPWRLIVPGVVYKTMEKRGKCCGCFPGVVELIVKTTEKFHQDHETPSAEIINLMDRLKKHHEVCETARMLAAHRQRNMKTTA